ncbi:GNAT family N-acetyltransferase [Agathobaculum sp. Marseille-P7918]|uniref:GNAT family N-acetyltransferase n=1 Tax=Agathobaculum sp. Marseille-P7918 TaxID=2479843 RepID=UPI000F62E009|nr:GNAT family N-acetyltransferase [Agathobaculum sp. Marseille-P7918]
MVPIIRKIRPEEYDLLREFLYQAIYLPEGVEPPPRSVVDLPELQVYVMDFGTRLGDHCLVAEVKGKVVGAAWCRIMEDYGHIDNGIPSLAIALLPAYRGRGIGTRLLKGLLLLLRENGYLRASLSVQKDNPALHLYQQIGFKVVKEKGTEYLMLWDDTVQSFDGLSPIR